VTFDRHDGQEEEEEVTNKERKEKIMAPSFCLCQNKIWFWPLLPVGATKVRFLREMVGLGGLPFTEHAPKPAPIKTRFLLWFFIHQAKQNIRRGLPTHALAQAYSPYYHHPPTATS
jgi:hypothetical protein